MTLSNSALVQKPDPTLFRCPGSHYPTWDLGLGGLFAVCRERVMFRSQPFPLQDSQNSPLEVLISIHWLHRNPKVTTATTELSQLSACIEVGGPQVHGPAICNTEDLSPYCIAQHRANLWPGDRQSIFTKSRNECPWGWRFQKAMLKCHQPFLSPFALCHPWLPVLCSWPPVSPIPPSCSPRLWSHGRELVWKLFSHVPGDQHNFILEAKIKILL